MPTRNQKIIFNWVSIFMILLLIELSLPASSALAQNPILLPRSFGKHLFANAVRVHNLVEDTTLMSLSGTNLVQDPSFEAYTPNPYWSEYASQTGTPLCSVTDYFCEGGPHTGSVWAWMGMIDWTPGTASDFYQNVTFSIGCGATLQFYFRILNAGSSNDEFFALVDGTPVFSANATQIDTYPAYTLISVDVSSYANGMDHKVEFYSRITTQYLGFSVMVNKQVRDCVG